MGSLCEVNYNECGSNPCLNGGICADGVNAFLCVCKTGYTGVNCEVDIDECSQEPCQNGGNFNIIIKTKKVWITLEKKKEFIFNYFCGTTKVGNISLFGDSFQISSVLWLWFDLIKGITVIEKWHCNWIIGIVILFWNYKQRKNRPF